MYIGCVLMNILSNVILNYVLTLYSSQQTTYIIPYYLTFIIGEIIVILFEWLIYYLIIRETKLSLYYSLFCNLISVTLGLFIFSIIMIIIEKTGGINL